MVHGACVVRIPCLQACRAALRCIDLYTCVCGCVWLQLSTLNLSLNALNSSLLSSWSNLSQARALHTCAGHAELLHVSRVGLWKNMFANNYDETQDWHCCTFASQLELTQVWQTAHRVPKSCLHHVAT